jgi:hypothetical protein
MMYRRFGLLFLVFALTAICSCEYDLENENVRKIEKPAQTHQIDLNLALESDTIKVFLKTNFAYDFNTYGLKIIHGDFSLHGKTWSIYSEEGQFTIIPQDYSPGYDSLSIVLYTNTGSGSIADLNKTEVYKAEKRWLLLIDGRPAPQLTLSKSITKEGLLKISWQKCNQYNFYSYELSGGSVSKSIKDADITSYIDSFYIGGTKSFRVRASVISDIPSSDEAYLGLDDSIPILKFSELGIDSLRIYWNKSKYKAKYKLNQFSPYPDTTIFESADDSSFTIPQPGLGRRTGFTLYTTPYHLNNTNSSYTKMDQKYYACGTFIAGNAPNFGFNAMDNVIYTNTYNNMECYNVSDLSLYKSYTITNLGYQGNYSCPTNSTKVATASSDNIYVFADKNLQNPEIFPYSTKAVTIDHFYLTDNDLVAVALQNKYELISISQKKVLISINISDYPVNSKWSCITTSKDGSYACIVTKNGIKIYNITDSSYTLTYTDNRCYRSALFNVNNPSQLFLTLYDNEVLEVRNVTDFSLINSIILPSKSEVLMNIDPKSGFLLLTDYTNLFIIDMIKQLPIFKMRTFGTIPSLYGNRLFSNDGYTLDISKYLPK